MDVFAGAGRGRFETGSWTRNSVDGEAAAMADALSARIEPQGRLVFNDG
jgi:hypothetical protein